MKRLYIPLLLIFLAISFLWLKNPMTTSTKKKVLISQVIEHPALNTTVEGIKTILASHDIDVQVESAQANPALASQIASKFVNQNPAVVVGVGTISAQSFAKYAVSGKVKMVFSSVTDPNGTLPKTPNICGVSNFVPLEPQLDLFMKIQPNLKRLGMLYNPGEMIGQYIAKKLAELCPKYGMELVLQTINKTADVAQSTVQLAKQCDAIFISNDNTALGAIQTILKLAKIPVYVSDTDAVALGAVAALGPNQHQVGEQTGRMIVKILNNQPYDAVEYPDKTELFINVKAAEKLGLVVPKDVLKQATCVVGSPT